MRGILAQMLGQKLTAQRTHDFRVPERRVHLGITEERSGMKVAGADCRPCVVDQHDLGMHVDVAAPALSIRSGNADKREAIISAKISAKRFDLIEEAFAGRVIMSVADVVLGLGRSKDDDIHATLQGGLEPGRDVRNRKGLILDIDRPAGRIDCTGILLENLSLAACNIEGATFRTWAAIAVATCRHVPLNLNDALAAWIG
jgi:hypothetical protein